MKDFQLFSEFPNEIQRLIFEEAFEESRRTALHLALVSRTVRSWIQPLLYRCITFRHLLAYGGDGTKRLPLFDESFPTRHENASLCAKFTRNVFFLGSLRLFFSENFLSTCSCLRSLALWDLFHSGDLAWDFFESVLSLDTLPELRRFSLRSSYTSEGRKAFHLPIFKNLTHLEIDPRLNFDWDGFSSLKNLTHFCLNFGREYPLLAQTSSLASLLQSTMQAVLQHVPSALQLLLVLIPPVTIANLIGTQGQARQIYNDVVEGKHDSRVVLGSLRGIHDSLKSKLEKREDFVHHIAPIPVNNLAWTHLPPNKKDMWMEAEETIQNRKRDQASQDWERTELSAA